MHCTFTCIVTFFFTGSIGPLLLCTMPFPSQNPFTTCSMSGLLVTMPDPRGRKSFPTMFSKTEDLPQLWAPTTTICGKWMMSEPTVPNTSCNLLITGIKASIVRGWWRWVNDWSIDWLIVRQGKREKRHVVSREELSFSLERSMRLNCHAMMSRDDESTFKSTFDPSTRLRKAFNRNAIYKQSLIIPWK